MRAWGASTKLILQSYKVLITWRRSVPLGAQLHNV